ncbi:hypothetical protein [Spirosoma flavum]|uniref:Uncharacterized protein n=1 Tax=Spirosoma flavum TaxID=2048557 RepID=A0ABW6ANH6_9BACT
MNKPDVGGPIKMVTIFDGISQREWVIKGWKIHFMLSEKKLNELKKLSQAEEWYKDPKVIETGLIRLQTCFNCLALVWETFNALPVKGDRLFDEDSGLIIQDRAFDAQNKVITFTLST